MEPQSKRRKCKMCGKLSSTHRDDYRDYCLECVDKVELQEDFYEVVPKRYRSASIGDFNIKVRAVLKHLNGDGLFLWGSPGVGKTHAMCVLAHRYIYQGFSVQRIIWSSLILKIRDSFKHPTVRHKTDSGGYTYDYGEDEEVLSEQDILEPLLEADKLFIEDIGTSKSEGSYESDFAIRTLERLLDERLENELPTFITANRSIEEIGKTFDARIASRIMGGCKIVKLSGKDRRYKEHS